jgi:3-hydroxyisobutyrate dehydrogenase
MNTTKIGWIGLGRMGTPMSKQLIRAGYPVTIYNRTRTKEEALISMGAKVVSSPMEIMQQSDVIIVMVSDDPAIREIVLGDYGLLGTDATGKIVINMSTVSPAISKEMAVLCARRGNHYLDAPVSGSVTQAEDGQLVIMAGGDEVIFEKVKHIFNHLGKLTLRMGGPGAGNTAKLAINMLLGIYAQGLAEAVVFGSRNEIKTEDLMTLINNSALGSAFIKIKGEAIIQSKYEAAFALKHIVKDLMLARDKGLNSPMGETAIETFRKAESAFGDEDIIAIIKQIRPLAKTANN